MAIGAVVGHMNAEERDEPSLGLKLLGYAFLGIFTFNLNHVMLPLGFGIALLLAGRAEQNVRARRAAAVTTFIFWLISIALF